MPIDRNARVVRVQRWGDYFLLAIESPPVGREARPGQFVMVKVSGEPFPLLRRPLSLHDARDSGFDLFFKVAGLGTEILARKRPGDAVDVLGPLGKGFTLPPNLMGKTAFCVGGGRGIAPLYLLGRRLQADGARVRIFYGGRSRGDIPLRDRFAAAGLEVACSTDDGSFGFAGLVTALVRREMDGRRPDVIYACGPDPMMKALAADVRERGVPAEFSLESMMGCGIGACWGCVHRIRGQAGEEWAKICEEGPVFAADRIVWTD